MSQDGKTPITDSELDRLLSLASTPRPPADAGARLLAALQAAPAQPQPSNVIAFTPRAAQKPQPRSGGLVPWLAALPLAASLAAGVWLGAMGNVPDFVSSASTVATASVDGDVPSGVEDVESLTEDDFT